ncbi:MAG: DUF6036 family nucleotidyltransferase [Pirellulaceae bacterium]|nr:DUF6036 family nucleotidyltransferase [Pirellulaceae bacterium]
MSIVTATLAMIDVLEKLQVQYVLVGSLAAVNYGLTRSTTDADFILVLGPRKLSEVVRLLGAGYQLVPQAGFELLTGRRLDVIQVLGTPFTIDVFALADDPFDQEQFSRRRKQPLEGREIVVPTAEDIVIQKLRWQRAKDLEDVRNVLAVQGDLLDWGYIASWCDRHGTRAVLERLRGEIPPL